MKILSHDGFNEVDDIKPIKKHTALKKEDKFFKTAVSRVKYEIKSFKELYKYIKADKAKKGKHQATAAHMAYVSKRKAARRSKISFKTVATPACAIVLVVMGVSFMSITKFSPKADTVTAENTTTSLVSQTATEFKATAQQFEESVANITSNNVHAYGLYVDGKFMGAVLDENELENALNVVLAQAIGDYDETTVTRFCNNVEVKEAVVDSSFVHSAEELIDKAKDSFSIELTTDYEVVTKIDYDTEYVYDDEKEKDYEKVTRKGEEGSAKTLYKLVFVDGVQTDLVYDSFDVVKEPVSQIVTVGTKEPEIVAGVSTGNFIWPVPYTTNVTSGYGARWGTTHTGLDISAGGCYGQNIVASDGGTVEWAGYDNSGYGNYVIIDHGNGYKTLYGHCSDVFVTAGQSVAQGEAIAAIGSTGDSTGPHLHFEVRQNDTRLDPASFV